MYSITSLWSETSFLHSHFIFLYFIDCFCLSTCLFNKMVKWNFVQNCQLSFFRSSVMPEGLRIKHQLLESAETTLHDPTILLLLCLLFRALEMQLLIVHHLLFYIVRDNLIENPNAPPPLLIRNWREQKLMVWSVVS